MLLLLSLLMFVCVKLLFFIRSMSENQGSVDEVNVEDLLSLHQQQMERKRQELINQQQQEMEELFVQQVRNIYQTPRGF